MAGSWWIVALLSAASLAAASGDPRLVEAVQKNDREVARSLLRQHVDVNAAQADGTTALAWAAHWNDLEMAGLLIRAGANVNGANEYGVTPLSLACVNGSAHAITRTELRSAPMGACRCSMSRGRRCLGSTTA